MKHIYPSFCKIILAAFILFLNGQTKAQCPACTAITFSVNLSSALDTSWSLPNQVRNGNCCGDNNCVKFVVVLNPNADLLNFDVTNPSPSGSAFYSINCGSLTSIGTPVCVYGQTTVCITYCKPGGDSPTYHIIQTKTVKASPNKTVRVGCSASMTVTGLSVSTITWTSIFPGTQGQYNSFLSCTSGCTLTNVTPTAVVSPYIDYLVSGTPNTICGGVSKDTVRIYTVPGLTTNVTPTNAVVCSGGSGSVAITATVSGGAPPYTYTWSTGSNSSSVNVGVGSYTVLIKDTASSCPAITRTVDVTSVTTPSAPTLSNNTPLCVGQTVSLTATNSGGTIWNWTGPNSFTSTAQNPTIPSAGASASGTYSATMTFSGCTGPPGTTNVTVSPIPAAPTAGGNTPLCAGSTISLTATFTAGASYNWSGPNGFTSTLQNPTIPAVTTAASGVYSVAATIGGCQGPTGTVNITVNPIPAAPTATNNSVLCAGQTLNLSAGAGGTTYSWTGPNGFTSTSQNPSIVAATTAAGGTYSVTQTILGCTSPMGTTIATINPIPAAPVAANNSAICAGQTLSLTSSVSGSIYSWTGPNGFTSTSQNPTIAAATTAASGTYSVTQTVLGCTSPSGTTAVTVNPIPAAPVAANNSAICAGQTLSLTSSVSGSIYSWTGPNGFTSTSQNPTIAAATTAASGTYSVTQTVLGCTSPSGTTAVTVNPIPAAPVAANNSAICAGQTLSLTSSVSGSIYSWTGPNGFTSTSQNPTIAAATTAASGTYSVTQTVLGCTSPSGTTAVTVNPIPAAPVAANNSAICAGQTLSLTSSVSGSIYSWTGPNGFTSTSQNPTIAAATTAASGTYSVTQTVLGCTSPSGTTAVTVNPIPAAPVAANNSAICAGQTLSLTSSVSGSIYSWTGPNGFTSTSQNPTIAAATTAASGTYSVTQTVLGCTSPSGTTAVTVNPIPAAPVAANNSAICAGQTLSLTSSVSGSIYSWTGPNGFTSTSQNPTIAAATTAASGTYSVTQTVLGCTSPSGTTAVTVNPIPAAPVAANNSAICAGQTLSLTSSVSGSIYSWTGPNGFTSTSQNPTIAAATTAASGTYSVTQTVLGCTSPSGTTAVTVNPIPAAPVAANNSAICAGQTLSLTSSVSGSIYSWTGPNGFTSTSQNPTIAAATTAASGTYSVTQTVLGCTSPSGTTAVTVNPIPAAPVAANNSAICAGQTLSLTSSVSGSIYSWTGPNGFTSTSQNPTIAAATTAASGTYSVTQTVLGCTSPSGTTAVTVNPIPAAPVAANNSAICAGQTLSLTSSVSGSIYSWTGPNGFTSTSQNPTIAAATTAASGTYSVTQTVLGCTSPSGTTAVTVNPIPAAPVAANNSAICAGQTLSLTSSVSGSIYSWTGPNGFTSTSQNPTIAAATTAASGTYSVTQTVLGCTSPSGTTAVTVNPIPAAPVAANNSAICAGQTLSLTSSVSGSIYSWTGPNGFTSTSQNPTIAAATTAASGTYSVTQTVLGCTSPSGTTAVTVNPIPAAPVAANNSAICAGQTLSLTSSVSGSIYSWTGPNGFTSTSQNPTIAAATTAASGTYSVTQTVLGCTSPSGTTAVTVNPIPAAPLAANNSTICAGQTLSLTANPAGSIYNWSGPNSFTSTTQNPVIVTTTTADAGTYSVTQIVLGCASPAGTTTVVISPIPSAPLLTSNSAICAGQSLSLTATFTPGASYDWSGPDTFTSSVQNPVIAPATTSASGTYTVFATIAGCQGPVATINVTVNPIPAAPTASNNSGICAGQTLSLTANPGGAIYSWTGPNGFTSTSQNPVIPNASTLEAGTYSVTQTLLGCTSPEGLTTASVSPIPSAPVLSSNSSICAGQTLSLSSVFVNGAIYVWSGPNSFTSTVQNPTIVAATTSASGTYSAFIDVSGCVGPMSTMVVSVNPIPAAPTATNNSSICDGQTLNLFANPSGATYSWTGPNGFTSTSQNPSIPVASTLATGDYSVTQTVLGCTSTEGITSVTVNPIPSPPVGNSNSPVCGGQPLVFTITPTGGTYTWIGPNSFTSSVQNPTISPAPFAATGDYSVTITLLGCTSPYGIVSASVGTIPDAPTAGANSPLCVGSTLSLTASFTTGVAYNWVGPNSFTAATQNPMVSPASTLATGVYTVNGSINGCDGPPTTVTVVVDVPAFVDAGVVRDTICATAGIIPVNGTVTGNGVTGVWNTMGTGTFNNPNNLSTFYNITPADTTAGIIKLVLSSMGGGCPSVKDTITYVVLRSPFIDVGANLNVCKNAYVALNATITGVTNTGTWTSTGTGSFAPNIATLNGYYVPSTADTTAGSIQLTLETTNNKGCISRKDSLLVTFIQSPKANFSNTNACATQSVNFSDLSAPSPSISNVSWNFGDGSGTSVATNPSYTYAASNVYTVTHIVTLSNGCQDTARKQVTVYNTPLADFTFSSVCVGNQSFFYDASSTSPDTLVAWNWNFGDGNTGNVQNPLNLYNVTGTFPVNFTVTSSKGCSNYAAKTVTVNPRPHADFSMSSTYVLAYDNVSFTDLSTPAPLASWSWNFGNTNTTTVQNPSNVYTDKGIYPVTLAIKDNNGCADTIIKDIYVTLLPMVPSAFTPNNDGHNDTLFVKGGPFVKMSFRVYNNWGELLFTSDDQEKGWDGKYKGQPAPLGVYVWILDVELYNGNTVRKTGDITILK